MNKKRWNRENKTASKKFLKEKKIVYSMERLAVRAVNDSKADRENKNGTQKIRNFKHIRKTKLLVTAFKLYISG